MTTCELANDRLEAHQEGLLEGDEKRSLEAHLAGCGDCRSELGRATEIERALRRGAARELPSAPAVAKGLGRARARVASRAMNVPMAAAAAVMVGMLALFLGPANPAAQDLIRSAKSGAWSDGATWEGGKVPGAGSRVQVRAGHAVVYDQVSDQAIRLLHVAGKLSFARDRDTRLDVGLIKVQAGENATEDGFECDARPSETPQAERPTLEVGLPNDPIPAGKTALIRLVYFEGMDKLTCPAIVSCGGRMEFHGAPMSRTWVKLGATAKPGDTEVTLEEAVSGWKSGDKVIVTATQRDMREQGTRRPGKGGRQAFTEERRIAAVEGAKLTLDQPLTHAHRGEGEYRGEVAVLSRNLTVESADPDRVRGHTMYHRFSAGGISYAEFRHLGKENVLGKYSIHFHLVGTTMRGSQVLGASIWDSHNRWITVHGTQYLVIRDCVGYQSVGHGFFLEDGTEVYNVLDRNLAVQAFLGKRLPKQVLPFDPNDGAGFWWANNLNTFTRNVSCENDRYGFRAEATPSSQVSLEMSVLNAEGSREKVDIRTLPFVRFEGNESHSEGLYGFRLGECVRGDRRVGPDARHPHVIRGMKIWDIHYAFRPEVPCLLVEDMKLWKPVYGVYHPDYDRHVYRGLHIAESTAEPFNRGHDDNNQQYGPLAVDGLTIERSNGVLIQVSQYGPNGPTASHFRNVTFKDNRPYRSSYIDTTPNGQPKNPPPDDAIPYYFHDHFGPGRTAKALTASMAERFAEGLEFQAAPAPVFGKNMRVVEVSNVEFPKLLDPVDDRPPQTIVTSVRGRTVRGTTADDGEVKRVLVNGREARALAPNFLEWEAELAEGETAVKAHAEDAAGNVERLAHEVPLAR